MSFEKKVKIAFVSHFPHLKMGGQRSMMHLIENLNKDEFEPIVICPNEGELTEKCKSINVETFTTPLYPIKPKHYIQLFSEYKGLHKVWHFRSLLVGRAE